MRRGLVGAALLAGAFVLYAPVLGGDFLAWDDTQHLAALRTFNLGRFWSAPYYGLYIPVTYTLWSFLWRAFASPLAFHVLNVGLHGLNAYFVYVLARRWGANALAAAFLFLTHPLQVEAVAWISGGRDVLAVTCGLAALIYDSRVLYVLSLLSKPFLFAWGLIARRPSWVLLAALAGGGLWLMQARWAGARVGAGSVFVALDALGLQTWHVLAPWTLHADYGRTPAAAGGWTFAALGFVTLLLSLGSRYLRGALLTLLPGLGLVPFAAQTISTVFDRYMYAPMIFVALFAARFRFAWVLVGAWAVLSFVRAGVWVDDRRLSEDMIAGAPASEPGLVNLAAVELRAGRSAAAVDLLRRAPDTSAVVRANLAHALWKERDLAGVRGAVSVLNDAGFLARNAHEPAALALMWRLDARVRGALGQTARESYCRSWALDPNAELAGELRAADVECGK